MTTCYNETGEDEASCRADLFTKQEHHDPGLKCPEGGYGWVIAISSFVLQGISVGLAFSVGIYYPEWLADLGAGHTATAWVGSINTGLLFAGGPIASMLINRYGHRFVCLLGSLMATTGLFASGFANNIFILYASYSVVAGLGFNFIYIPSVVLVGEYFTTKRHIVMPLTVSGVGLFCLIFPPILQILITYFSWRGALIISAGFSLQAAIFAALLRPLSHDNLQNFKKRLKVKVSNDAHNLYELTLLKDLKFWLLFINNVMWNMGSIILIVLVFDYARECGISAVDGSILVAAVGFCGTLGRIGAALFSGICNRFYLYNAATGLSGLAIGLVPVSHTYAAFMSWCCFYGLCFGVQLGLLALLTAELFGVERLTSAFGYLIVSNGIGTLTGVPIAGGLYEYTQSYEIPFYFGGLVTILSALIMLVIPVLQKREMIQRSRVQSPASPPYI